MLACLLACMHARLHVKAFRVALASGSKQTLGALWPGKKQGEAEGERIVWRMHAPLVGRRIREVLRELESEKKEFISRPAKSLQSWA